MMVIYHSKVMNYVNDLYGLRFLYEALLPR